MAIIKAGLTAATVDLRNINRIIANTTTQMASGKKYESPAQEPVAFSDAVRFRNTAQQYMEYNENLNKGVQVLRTVEDIQKSISQFMALAITQLEEGLTSTGAAREKALDNFNVILEQINQIARPQDEAVRKLTDDATFPIAGDLMIKAGLDGFTVTLKAMPVTTATDGLNIPDIFDPATATNADIEATLQSIFSAQTYMTEAGNQLAVDQLNLQKSIQINQKFINNAQINQARNEEANIERAFARAQAAEVRQALSIESIRGLTLFKNQLYDLLK